MVFRSLRERGAHVAVDLRSIDGHAPSRLLDFRRITDQTRLTAGHPDQSLQFDLAKAPLANSDSLPPKGASGEDAQRRGPSTWLLHRKVRASRSADGHGRPVLTILSILLACPPTASTRSMLSESSGQRGATLQIGWLYRHSHCNILSGYIVYRSRSERLRLTSLVAYAVSGFASALYCPINGGRQLI